MTDRQGIVGTAGETPPQWEPPRPRGDDDLTVGMYHRNAGTRTAGGVAVFVQETVAELARSRDTYLYTKAGDVAHNVAESEVTVVPIESDDRVTRLGAVLPSERVPGLSRSVSTVADAALDGTLAHIEERVDVLFTHDLFDTILLSNWLETPVVRLFHGCQLTGLASRLAPSLARTAATVANSQQTARELATELGQNVDWVAYPGVNVETFSPDAAPAVEREALSILYVGRFVESKGVYDLVDAYAELDVAVPTHLTLLGRGETATIRERVAEFGLADSVDIVEEVDHDRLPRYYAAADVFCLPTHYESFGMVNLEAMACETPVVTTDLPGIREYATDGENALLVSPGDTTALADRLADLLASPDIRSTLAANGRATARAYSWERTAEQLLAIGEHTVKKA